MPENQSEQTGGSTLFVVVNYMFSLLVNISLSEVNEASVIALTAISIAALVYKMVSTRIKDKRAGIDVFKFRVNGKPKKVTKNTSLAQLIEILNDAEVSGNHDYALMAIEHYRKLNPEK